MIWKTHPKYRNYEVSNTGLIRGKVKKIILKPRYNKSIKPSVTIHRKDGLIVQKLVGEMVLETYRGKNKNGHNAFINIDGNVDNNHIDNLTWRRFKYTYEPPVIQIDSKGTIIQKWDSVSQACNEQGFTPSSIVACCNNQRETHKGFYWLYNNGKSKYITAKRVEVKATSDTEELIFHSILDAYYHFTKNSTTFAIYESFYASVVSVKNNPRKKYLGYKWKLKQKTKRIEIYG